MCAASEGKYDIDKKNSKSAVINLKCARQALNNEIPRAAAANLILVRAVSLTHKRDQGLLGARVTAEDVLI